MQFGDDVGQGVAPFEVCRPGAKFFTLRTTSKYLQTGSGDLDAQGLDLGCFLDRRNRFFNQFFPVDRDTVGGAPADRLPELFELFRKVQFLVELARLTLTSPFDNLFIVRDVLPVAVF